MKHSEILAILKQHFRKAMTSCKAKIDTEGPHNREHTKRIAVHLDELEDIVKKGCTNHFDAYGLPHTPEESTFYREIQSIIKENNLSLATDSKEYRMLEKAYAIARYNHFKDIVTYNDSLTDYSLLNERQVSTAKKSHNLNTALEAFLKEIEPTLKYRSLIDLVGAMRLLKDHLGEQYNIVEANGDTARELKNTLMKTPKGRNKMKATKEKPLIEQVNIAEKENLPLMSASTTNKYLGYFSNFFEWAKNNKYIDQNHFKDLKVKAVDNTRSAIDTKNIQAMLRELKENNTKCITNDSQYWGAMMLIYTGARSGEIASLRVSDIKQAPETKIWYFEINDNDETKSLKNNRSARQIPIHSALLDAGLIEYKNRIETKIKNKTWPHREGIEINKSETITYLEFMRKILLLFREVHNVNHIIKVLSFYNIPIHQKK